MDGAMHLLPEQTGSACGVFRPRRTWPQIPERRILVRGSRGSATCRCATRHRLRGVMLHLRACHASKAAILTIPALHVPVENRSPDW